MIRKTLIILLTILALGTAIAWIGSLVAPLPTTRDWTSWSGPGSKTRYMIHNGWIGIARNVDVSSPNYIMDWRGASHFAGFWYWRNFRAPESPGGRILRGVPMKRVTVVVFPLWFPFLLFFAYPVLAFIWGPWRRHRHRRKGLCLKCGYDLTGNVSGRCPECGEATSGTCKPR